MDPISSPPTRVPTATPSRRGRLQAAAIAILALWTCGLAGCAPEREPLEMETVELGAGPTDQLTADDDAVEAVSGGQGLDLPAGFPAGLPVPPSASIVGRASGRVTFGTEDPVDRARSQLVRELRQAGWTAGEGDRFERDGASVRITFEQQAERTTVVYRY